MTDILDDPEAYYELRTGLNRLVESAGNDSLRWFPQASDVPLMTLALCGEVGELANLIKKVARGSHSMNDLKSSIRSELADIFTYYLGICYQLDVDPLADYADKQMYNERRFGHGHS